MLTTRMIRIKNQLRNAGISTFVLADMAGVSPSELSSALRDLTHLGDDKEAKLLTMVVLVNKYREALLPLRLPYGSYDLCALINSNIEPADVGRMVSFILGREAE